MGIMQDMQRAQAQAAAAEQRANTTASRQAVLVRRKADLAIAAAQQAAMDSKRQREHRRLYAEARTADAAPTKTNSRAGEGTAGKRAGHAGSTALSVAPDTAPPV